jgi:hypothetical protein
MRRFALPFLVLLTLLSSMVLIWLWITPPGHMGQFKLRQFKWQAPEPKSMEFNSVLPLPLQVAAVENSRLVAMQERPIFSVTRRPPPPPPPPAAPPPVDVLSGAKVTGIYSGPGGTGVLLNLGGKSRRVRVNENVEGWVLAAIEGRSATFVSAGQTRSLPLGRAALTAPSAGIPLSAPTLSNPEPAVASEPVPSRPRPRGAVFGGS